MRKNIFWKTLAIAICLMLMVSACAPARKPLDRKVGFSQYLEEAESYIRMEKWSQAAESVVSAEKSWKKIKPILQVDIDHDYVNDIEKSFILLKGYMETEEKPDSLAHILLLQDLWQQIGEM